MGKINVTKFIKKNSSAILTIIGAGGVVLSVITAAKATPKALTLIAEAEYSKGEELTTLEKVEVAGPTYIPTALIAFGTIVCMFSANALNKQQQALLTGALQLSENAFKEYKEKVAELFGSDAHHKIHASIVEDICEDQDFDLEDGKELFYEEISGHMWEATRLDVANAMYHFNRNFTMRGYADLNELYSFLDIPTTDLGCAIGWNIYDGETTYGYTWVDFIIKETIVEGGLKVNMIYFPFGPHRSDVFEV